MVLSTGKVAFTMMFDNGDKETFYFNPNDKDIQTRIQNFEKDMEKRIAEIEIDKYKDRFEKDSPAVDFESPENLFEMTAEELEALRDKLIVARDIENEYNKAVKAELDEVFKSNVSEVAFKYCEPFDIVIIPDGKGGEDREMYIIHFLKWLMQEIKIYGAKNSEVTRKHIDKYRK